MRRLVLGFLWIGLSSCSSAAPPAPASVRVAREDIPEFRHFPVRLRTEQAASSEPSRRGAERPSVDAATEADLKFLRNARHAIELYREFLKRAAGDDNYAEAVAEARERIDELEQTMAFVEAGMRERAAK